MTRYEAGSADIAVVGAGHAGIEAALAAARLGRSVLLFTINLDAVGNMPCNPAIGGTAKGHLVYEIDALGGEMGKAADAVTLQTRTLNLGKGPAVHSRRVQADRAAYRLRMKHTIEKTPNVSLIQAEIVDILFDGDRVCGVVTAYGAIWRVRAAILCTGTYLGGRVIAGETAYASGPDGMLPATHLTDVLRDKGVRILRFKTGTPARILRSSIDLDALEVQPGETPALPFSSETDAEAFAARMTEQMPCYILYTNAETHRVIRENLHRSPLYGGQIEGVGPRYCPSIEDKVVRFADKERHQLFLEPMGENTEEMYLQGFSSSMPEEVQRKMLATLPGFAHAQMMRTAYAIEYDCIDPTELSSSLRFKAYAGLYGAGQFNGTSGYEEAAAQGLIAGINAVRELCEKPPLILTRDSSYIGTLIDDLVTKGTSEPYRMMTSRSEYRLLLRQDNADARLTPIGHEIGLISDARYAKFCAKQDAIAAEIARAESTTIHQSEALSTRLAEVSAGEMTRGMRLAELLRRPAVTYDLLAPFDPERPALDRAVTTEAEIQIKYEGYIKRQLTEAARMRKLETRILPADADYASMDGLRLEARQKLAAMRPQNIGQAARISGVSPADISVLLLKFGK